MKTIDSIDTVMFDMAKDWNCMGKDGVPDKEQTVAMILDMVSACINDLTMPDMSPIIKAVYHYVATKAKGEEADKAVESLTKLINMGSSIDIACPYLTILSYSVDKYNKQKYSVNISDN